MNKHILSVMRYELLRNLKRKGFLFATFGVPLIGFLIFAGFQFFTGTDDVEDMAQLDFDFGLIESAGYVDLSGQFPEPGELAEPVLTPYADEAQAKAALENGDIEVYYIIAEDYLESGNVMLVVPYFSIGYVVAAEAPIESLLYGQWVNDVEVETLIRLRVPSQIDAVEFSEDSEEGVVRDEDADFVLIYGFTLIFLLSIFMTNGYLMQSVIEEKESKLVEILISSMRPGELLSGKIFAYGILGLLQICVFIFSAIMLTKLSGESSALIGTMLNNIDIPMDKLPILLIYFVLSYLFFAAGFGAVGAISNSMSEGPNIALIFTLPAVIPFYFLTVFIENPNGTIPLVFSMLPVTAPIAMVMRLSVTSVPLIQIIISVSVIILSDFVMIWFAGRLFRMNTLLSGHTPKLKDIPSILRG